MHPQVSGYRLIARRGRGGAAEVWEAESPGGHRVALKLVHLSTDLRSGELRALKITRGIRHPGLLVVHGAWQVENLLVISMELADRSLWERFLEANVQGLRGIRRGELIGYLDPVADAIDYLNGPRHTIDGRQGVGIQHRDLKPPNVLLFGDRAKVADFGMARVIEGCVTGHSGPCTIPYAAPEYFGGRTSRQSDQYALAVTYCQLRGGRIPFHGTTAQMAVGHMCNDPNLEGLPEPERPVIARALAKRPEDRWPDCRSFVDALKEVGTAGRCSIPDALPRDRCDISSVGVGAGESSALDRDPADSDFIPVDSGEFATPYDSINSAHLDAGFRRGQDGFGPIPRIRAWILGHLSQYGHSLRDRLRIGRPTQTKVGRRAAGEAGVRRYWSARLERIPALVAARLDRLRQTRDRAGHGTEVRSRWERIGSIAALVFLGLALWNVVWTFVAQQRRAGPSRNVSVAETATGPSHDATTSGSSRTGITQKPTLEAPIVADRPAARVIRGAPSPPETTPRMPVDSPEPEKNVTAGRHAAPEPEESMPRNRLVVAKRANTSSGKNSAGAGLKSALAWLQTSDLIRLVATPAPPSAHRVTQDPGSAGTGPRASAAPPDAYPRMGRTRPGPTRRSWPYPPK